MRDSSLHSRGPWRRRHQNSATRYTKILFRTRASEAKDNLQNCRSQREDEIEHNAEASRRNFRYGGAAAGTR